MDEKTKQELEQFLTDILENVDDTNPAKTKRLMRDNVQRTTDQTE